MQQRFERLVMSAARRPVLTLSFLVALALGGGLLALSLEPDTSTSTFVSSSSESYKATQDFARNFGGDTVVILIREPLTDLVETKDLGTLSRLEACLAGQVVVQNQQLGSFTPAPAGSKPAYGGAQSPCGHLMSAKPAQIVYGPGTFLNRAVAAVNTQIRAALQQAGQHATSVGAAAYKLARSRGYSRSRALAAQQAAEQLASQQALQQFEQFAVQSGISGVPRIDDPHFIPQIVFDPLRGANEPKARFAYLFPTSNSALIQVRLKSSLTTAQEARAISWIKQAVQMPMFRSAHGGTYTVTGEPVVVHALAADVTASIGRMLLVALVVMAATLLLVFKSRPRLLPLLIALIAAGITFGITRLLGASLTMASIAVLPILIGLAVDYAIQFQSRVREAGLRGAARMGAPTLATAALATATGFLVLLLSPVPMVRGFGVLLVIGIAIALICALTAGPAVLALPDVDGGQLGAAVRGAGDIVRDAARAVGRVFVRIPRPHLPRRGSKHVRDPVGLLTRRPGIVLALAAIIAVAGWIADTQTSVQSDVTKLVPSGMPALRDLRTLEHVTGVSGEIDVTVRAHDVTRLPIVRWMSGYEQQLLTHYGYLERKGCAHATLCPALSLPDLFSGGTQAGQGSGSSMTQSSIDTLLADVPAYFSQAVITPGHREATLAFGIRLMPLTRQQQVIDYMRAHLRPPAGVTARLAGLPVLAAEANAALASSGRRLLTLIVGLVAVGLVLLLVFRSVSRALVPLIPIALATGWSALILYATQIPLNPMSATLGALVIAISTEFSVLLSERYRQERAAGYEQAEALARTYRSTGRAVIASGITAIAGFGVLIASDITMLRDFGLVTLVDLTVSLCGVLLVLPAVFVTFERRDARAPAGARRRFAAGPARLRRRPRVA
jgi:hydrophobe/amphiphile efflux-3 (HAE3) family protein